MTSGGRSGTSTGYSPRGLPGRAVARIVVAVLVALGVASIADTAAGSPAGPVPYVSLHLDQSGATFSVPGWTVSSSGCNIGEPSTQQSFDAALSKASDGTGVLTLTLVGGGGSLSDSVSATGPTELQLDLKGGSTNGVGTYNLNLTGYGTTFTGSAQLSTPVCTYTSSSATLTLAGTGLTVIQEKVSVALDPDKVNVCTTSCTSVLATATVEDASTGQPITGHTVAFSSSDQGVKIGSVTDHGNGTYTASLEPSEDPGDVTITAADTSAFGDPSGTANLEQDCKPNASAGPRTQAGSGSATASKDCTHTRVRCVDTGSRIPGEEFLCEVVVTDIEKHPTEPTGAASITISYSAPAGMPSTETLVRSLTPRTPKFAICFFSPPPELVPAVFIAANYRGDTHHGTSGSPTYSLLKALSVTYHTTARDRAELKKAADSENHLANKGTLGVGALALISPEPVSKGILATAAVTWAFGKVDADSKSDVANSDDPADMHYTALARPQAVRLPALPTLPGPVAAPLRALLTNALRAHAVDLALATSVNRASTAALEGDQTAVGRQRKAIARYFSQLASLTRQDIVLQKQLAAAADRAHLGTATISSAEADAANRARLAQSQPPGYVLQVLMAGGESRTAAIANWHALSQFLTPGTFHLSSLLTNPALIASEKQAASVFSADAKHG